MRNLIRIQNAIYQQPWAILPSTLESIREQFEMAMAGNIVRPMVVVDEDEEDTDELSNEMLGEMDMPNVPSWYSIAIDGILGKHLSSLETECGGVDCDTIAEQIDVALADPNSKGMIFRINSPGGTVTGIPELAAKIADASTKKTTIAFTDTMAASGALWLASQCNAFYCTPSSNVGSVGVYSIYTDMSQKLAADGIRINAISAGEMKLAGASWKPMTDQERAMFQAQIDAIYNEFKSSVMAKRPALKAEDCNGQVFSGTDAVLKGFCDGNINSFSELLDLISMLDKRTIE